MCLSVLSGWMYTVCVPSAQWGQKRVPDCLKLGWQRLWRTTQALGIESRSSTEQQTVLTMSHLQPSGNIVLQLSIAWLMSFQQASFCEEESEELIEFPCQVLKKLEILSYLKLRIKDVIFEFSNSSVALNSLTFSICQLGLTVLKSYVEEMCVIIPLLLYSL